MNQLWADVDQYFTETLIAPDGALDAAITANHGAQLPEIDVAPVQGKLL